MGIRRDLVHQPELEGRARVVERTLQRHPLERAPGHASLHEREQLRRELETERYLVQADPQRRIVGDDSQVAAEHQHAATGDGVTVDARDRRAGIAVERVDQVIEKTEEAGHAGEIERRHFLQVETRREGAVRADEEERTPRRSPQFRDQALHEDAAERVPARGGDGELVDVARHGRLLARRRPGSPRFLPDLHRPLPH